MVADADLLSLSVDSPALSSALQVFSSVGGLALLAEHLPLLYPNFSRHSSPVDVIRDTANANVGLSSGGVGLGHDWVTVESAEEIYEVFLSLTSTDVASTLSLLQSILLQSILLSNLVGMICRNCQFRISTTGNA